MEIRHKIKKTRFIFYKYFLSFFVVIFWSRMSVFLLEGTVHYLRRYGYPMKKVATG